MDTVAPLAQALAEHGLSLVIVIATLMSFVHLRNAHLSDRARSCVDEFLYKAPKLEDETTRLEHCESLVSQIEIFIERYKATNLAFVLLSIALVMFMLSIIFCSENITEIQKVGLVLAGTGIVVTLWALYLAAKDFSVGHKTLEQHLSIVRRKH